jgi:hypothetical protein
MPAPTTRDYASERLGGLVPHDPHAHQPTMADPQRGRERVETFYEGMFGPWRGPR